MFMNIPDDLARRLNQLAEQEGASINDLLKTLLDQYAPQSPKATLADLVDNARTTDLTTLHSVDTAEQSREILHSEYADYIKRRMNEGTDGDSDR